MNIDSIKIYPDIHRSKFKDRMQERNVSEGNKWTSVGLCDEKQLNRGYQSGSLARENNFGAVTFGSAASNIQKTVKDNLFDKIFTAEDYPKSKPAPDCYITGAAYFKTLPEETLVFEDSVNGLISGRDSGMILVGLATTNPPETVRKYTSIVIKNFVDLSLEKIDGLSYAP